MDELWDVVKQEARAEGRMNRWSYILEQYRNEGGSVMAYFLFGAEGTPREGRLEVLGELSETEIICLKGEIPLILQREEVKLYKHKFGKRFDGKLEKREFDIDGRIISAYVSSGGELTW